MDTGLQVVSLMSFADEVMANSVFVFHWLFIAARAATPSSLKHRRSADFRAMRAALWSAAGGAVVCAIMQTG